MSYLIGDVHGNPRFVNPAYFQAGDVAIGDLLPSGYENMGYSGNMFKFPEPRFFICGNHEHYPSLKQNLIHPYEVNEGSNLYHVPRGYWNNGVLYIGGANSLFTTERIVGFNYWPELEILSYTQLDAILNGNYPYVNTVVAHTCPEICLEKMFNISIPTTNLDKHTVCRDLNLVFKKFRPERWFFGHFHFFKTQRINGCDFTCLGIGDKIHLDNVRIEIPKIKFD